MSMLCICSCQCVKDMEMLSFVPVPTYGATLELEAGDYPERKKEQAHSVNPSLVPVVSHYKIMIVKVLNSGILFQ